jgi:hypothetical protein
VKEFQIIINFQRKNYRIRVEQLPSDPSFDYYKVYLSKQTITFKNNGPVMRRHKLKYRRPQWSVHESDYWNAALKEKIIAAINKYLLSGE